MYSLQVDSPEKSLPLSESLSPLKEKVKASSPKKEKSGSPTKDGLSPQKSNLQKAADDPKKKAPLPPLISSQKSKSPSKGQGKKGIVHIGEYDGEECVF
jgi:hypothetical protein